MLSQNSPVNRPFRKSLTRKALQLACLCVAPLLASALAHADTNSVWTDADLNASWSDANNWTPLAVPNNGNLGNNYSVEITNLAPPHVDTTITIDNLTVDAGASVIINSGQSLNILGPTLTNNGNIQIDQLSSNANLNFEADTLLTGIGTVSLNDFNPNARLTASSGVTLTQDTNHTINGVGQIDLNLINNGTVNANFSNHILLVNSAALTNTGLLEATNTGTLQLQGNTINNSGGTIINNGGTVLINNTTVSGGTLTGAINVTNSSFTNLSISLSSHITIAPGATLNINGPTLNNDGIIQVDSLNSNADINFASNTQITGSGAITLDDYNPNAHFTSSPGVTVTQASTHSINGIGQIDAALINNGTINANDNIGTRTIILQTNDKTNNNLIQATNGGIISINGINLTNTNGLITSDGTSTPNPSSISISSGANIIGGNLGGSGAINVTNSTFTNVTVNAGTTVFNSPGSTLSIAGGTLLNNGSIQIDQLSSNASINFTVNTQITGTGTIFLDDYNPNVRFTANPGVSVTQASTHTISGVGQIDATLINNGTINANDNIGTRTIILQTNDKTNNNLIEATSGGIISIVGINLTNTSGLISSDAGSTSNPSSISISNGANIIGGTIGGNGTVNVINATFTNVTINAGTPIFDTPGSVLSIAGGTLINNGFIQIDAISSNAVINFTVPTLITGTGSIFLDDFNPNARFTSSAGATVTQGPSHTIEGIGEIDAPLINNGSVIANQNIGTHELVIGATTTNNGLFQASSGLLFIDPGVLTNLSLTTLTGGTYRVDANSNITFPNSFSILAAHVILNGCNTTFNALQPVDTITSAGQFDLKNNAFFSSSNSLTTAGIVNVDPTSQLFISGNYTQTAGTTTINGSLNPSDFYFLAGGTLKGSGSITGPVSNTGGTVSPGNSPGTLTIIGGPYTQSHAAELDVELASPTSFDLLAINGAATIDGTLDVTLLNGFVPTIGQSFTILTASGGLTGTFSTTILPPSITVTYTADSVILNGTAVPEPASLSLLALASLPLLTRRRRNTAS